MPDRFALMVAAAVAGLVAQVARAQPLTNPDARDDVFYQFMPIAWRDSNNDAQRFGDFGGMTASLDYLQQLGITAVWMNPIFPTNAYHGYQHGPANQVNSRFGTEAQFLAFVAAAHARGIKVFLDYVAYGISQNSVYYQSAFNNPQSQYDTWLAFTNAANTQYTGSVYTTWNGQSVGFIHWNLADPNPVNLNITWARHWLDPNGDSDPSDGIDGFRLDHVYAQSPDGPNGWGANLPFWQQWTSSLKALKPTVVNFAEQGDWGSYGSEFLPAFDAAFTIPFQFAARDALNSETASGLYTSMQATLAALPSNRTALAIIGNHDVDRLTSVLGGSLTKAKAAAAALILQPLTPIIYYGDEIGMLGVKGNWGTDANDIPMREPFKWNAVAGPPMSNYFVLNSQAYTNRASRDNDGRSVQEQAGVPSSLLETYRSLIALRRNNVALRRGMYRPITNSSTKVWSFLRYDPGQSLIVAINVSGQQQSASLSLSGLTIPQGGSPVTNLVTSAAMTPITPANQGAYSITISAYGYLILSAQISPPAVVPGRIDGLNIPFDLGEFSLVSTQSSPTGLGDNVSELDRLYVRPTASGLVVGITGNLQPNGTALALLLDADPGGPAGQSTLNIPIAPPPNGLQPLTGLDLDPGFRPDRLLFVNTAGGTIYVDSVTLTAAGASKTYRGSGSVNSGSGALAGGSNPNGVQVAMNNTNAAGVTDSEAAAAATATSGFEVFVPFGELGVTADACRQVGVAAFIVRSSGEVSNQWLPGVGGGFATLGTAPDMTAVPGDQFALVPRGLGPDWDRDGDLTPADIASYVNDWAAALASGSIAADFDGNGQLQPADIAIFVNAWFAGLSAPCP